MTSFLKICFLLIATKSTNNCFFQTLQQHQRVLTGHTGSVLCLQYDEKVAFTHSLRFSLFLSQVIISGSSDSTVRVWDVESGEMVNTLIHHCEAVLHLSFNFKVRPAVIFATWISFLMFFFVQYSQFCNGMMVTCSKDRSIAVRKTEQS